MLVHELNETANYANINVGFLDSVNVSLDCYAGRGYMVIISLIVKGRRFLSHENSLSFCGRRTASEQ